MTQQEIDGDLAKFQTGAVRGSDRASVRYDLISPIALRALAATYAEGATKYHPMNWEMGMPVSDLLNHVLAHVNDFLGGDRSEPHLAHAFWGVGAAIHSFEKWPHLNTDLRGPGCELTSEQRARIAEVNAQRTKAKTAAAEPSSGVPRADDGVQESPFDRQKATGRLQGVPVQHGPSSPGWPKQV